ncbi:gamma-glutamyl hydrolase 2 isoform X2 [Ziziphus jujuba]|uniref:folate gamma-glutamyl hydrolase n=1 Tax=Ziziphus jujuba TaxID=326968 RepID=A0ABM3I6F3_ZIZJJ|nr:gamma-glutamyl hydrolase 2 isoform X2 [Ziziphus jujuba]
MPSNFLSDSASTPTSNHPPSDSSVTAASSSSDSSSDALSLTSSSSSVASRLSEMWNYLWIPFMISLSKELSLAKAQSGIFLPGEFEADSSSPRCTEPEPRLNYRPVIGILSHPGDGASGRLSNATNASYIAASYVKFVESAGARVIPLIYNEPPDILFQKLNLVNGVLFTGGWCKSGRYREVVEKIFKKILEKNDAGDHFPLYAICLGFELISVILTKDRSILEPFNAADMASSLQFTKDLNIEGTVFQRFPPDLLKKLSTDCLAMQNHRYGISPERFQENQYLSSFFKILTTCKDEDDKVYVSTLQGRNYPVTAFQWHPEKNAFEWGYPTIPHSEDAIQVTQHVANYLVRAPEQLEEENLLKLLSRDDFVRFICINNSNMNGIEYHKILRMVT